LKASPDKQRVSQQVDDAFDRQDKGSFEMKRAIVFAAVLLAGAARVFAQQPPQGADLEAIALIGDQVRAQGHACVRATAAQRDLASSRPDEAVWVLTCEDARYRVRLTPDGAAKIELLPK
jgi:hypothetical protein